MPEKKTDHKEHWNANVSYGLFLNEFRVVSKKIAYNFITFRLSYFKNSHSPFVIMGLLKIRKRFLLE